MDPTTQSNPQSIPLPTVGQIDLIARPSSPTDSTRVTGVERKGEDETTIAGSATTSVHAVFNLDTGMVNDAIKETRELLDHQDIVRYTEPTMHHENINDAKSKPKKLKKKVSASWTAEWSEDAFDNKQNISGK